MYDLMNPDADNITKFMISQCECGAVTVSWTDDNGNNDVSMREDTFRKALPHLVDMLGVNEQKMHNCNHCANGWGIDICGCGSGEPIGECDNDFEECRMGNATQTLDVIPQSVQTGDIPLWIEG